MADIGTNVIAYLKTITAVTDQVGTDANARIYVDRARQGMDLPYITIEVFEGSSFEYLDGITGIAKNRLQIDVYAETAAEAYTLAESVRLAPLQHYRGTLGDTFANDVRSSEGYRRGFVPPVTGGNKRQYWISRDFNFTYHEATEAI